MCSLQEDTIILTSLSVFNIRDKHSTRLDSTILSSTQIYLTRFCATQLESSLLDSNQIKSTLLGSTLLYCNWFWESVLFWWMFLLENPKPPAVLPGVALGFWAGSPSNLWLCGGGSFAIVQFCSRGLTSPRGPQQGLRTSSLSALARHGHALSKRCLAQWDIETTALA